ncbi:MAG TPA: HAMP domain-containing sensor histidine kinase [Candidatus Kapabacteria bacterium]|nr:HAMP domain-containing sensor histidine kinase [Candidatus Kapabacteria bacterium]
MKFFPRSLQSRAALVIALAFVALLSFFFVSTYFSIRSSLLARSDDEVRDELRAIAAALHPDISGAALAGILAEHRSIGESQLRFVILERRRNGIILLASEPDSTMPGDVVQHIEQHPRAPLTYATAQGTMRLIGITSADFIVGAAYNTIALDEAENSVLHVFAYYLIAGLLLGILGGIILSRYLIGPIGALANSARTILNRPDRFPARLPISNTILEVADLARSINELLDARERALDQQRSFAADAAHELRTPLTVLKGEIEVELRLMDPASPQADLLRSNLEEIERLISTVQDLLELAEIEAERELERSKCSLLDAIQYASERLHPLAASRNIFIRIPEWDVMIAGEEKRITRLLYNLLLNAIQHSAHGSQAEIRLQKTNEGCDIKIVDDGTGIPPERLAHLFERFYHTREGREERRGGAGLGLAIVKSIADHYGFTLAFQSAEGIGTTVTVHIPLAAIVG